jgi:hypothetical protein
MHAVGVAYPPQAHMSRSSTGATARERPLPRVAWFACGALLALLVPFLFSLLKLEHDWYYPIYFAVVGLFLGVYESRGRVR